jgi:hypothetical protein
VDQNNKLDALSLREKDDVVNKYLEDKSIDDILGTFKQE